ncbi:MAG: hypothetical protein FWE70_03555, partial [Oscillospiraceae bacterium]|nr:hypothetical protein [Oscillospiraceae bacterium]
NADYEDRLAKKRDDLERLIEDADQMISEMNRFSDYVITQMDMKRVEMGFRPGHARFRDADGPPPSEESINRAVETIRAVTGTATDADASKREHSAAQAREGREAPSAERAKAVRPIIKAGRGGGRLDMTIGEDDSALRKAEAGQRAAPAPSKRDGEIVTLYAQGLSETDIAKRLKIGKGEVALVLGLRK